MPQVTIALDQLATMAGNVFHSIFAGTTAALGTSADAMESRASRLAAAASRLKDNLGEDHPEVIVLRREASSAAALQAAAHSEIARRSRLPQLGAEEWLLFGRVMTWDGQPAEGIRVHAADVDRKLKNVRAAETDDYGEFAIGYHRQDFPEDPPELPDLYVFAENRRGMLLYRSRGHVRFHAGRAEYVVISLEQEPPKRARAAKKATRRSRSRKAE